jgi:hypothetical protein
VASAVASVALGGSSDAARTNAAGALATSSLKRAPSASAHWMTPRVRAEGREGAATRGKEAPARARERGCVMGVWRSHVLVSRWIRDRAAGCSIARARPSRNWFYSIHAL